MQFDKTKDIQTLFEVYDKRALTVPISELTLLDRDTSKRKMETSARHWGGCVVEVKCRITKWRPLQREVLETRVIFVHAPKEKPRQSIDDMTRKQLMRKIKRGL
jgi:hypothetical protein